MIQPACGNEEHWCDLRIRTLWSELQPEHYIAAVGQLTDPQASVKKQMPLSAFEENAVNNVSSLKEDIRRLESVFDIVRLVDPTSNSVLELDEQGELKNTKGHCAAFWNNDGSCANCISARALTQRPP